MIPNTGLAVRVLFNGVRNITVGSVEAHLVSNVRNYTHFFFVAQQPKLGVGALIVEVYRSHTIRHTHTHTHN